MEVHEFNPERRFVFVPPTGGAPDAGKTGSTSTNKRMSAEPSPRRTPESQRDKEARDADKGNRSPRIPSPKRDKDDATQRRESSSRRPRDTLQTEYKPSHERRRSRQERPIIDTYDDGHRTYHRRSNSAISGERPDYFSARQGSRYGDQMLSPDAIKYSTNGREQVYYEIGGYDGRTLRTGTFDKRSVSPGRRNTLDERYASRSQVPESRDRRDTSRIMENGTKSHTRNSTSRSGGSSIHNSRERSRQTDEHYTSSRPSGKPTIVQESKAQRTRPERDNMQRERSPMRSQTLPVTQERSATGDTPTAPSAPSLKSAATFAAAGAAAATIATAGSSSKSSALPYPDEGIFAVPVAKAVPGRRDNPEVKLETVAMPDMPPDIASYVVAKVPTDKDSDSGGDSKRGSWQPGKFDPEKQKVPVERPMGNFRRHSESKETSQALPVCPRATPVAGKSDWFTLYRSDFNVCPTCYEAVFAKTEHRSQFQVLMRTMAEPTACDFASPWYRIAWLAIERKKEPDLRLLADLASLKNANKDCPGNRISTRTWLGIRDPSTGIPVPRFTVCAKCASMVETLLPNLKMLFETYDERERPFKATCSLHHASPKHDFVLYFDAFEITSDRAYAKKTKPHVGELTRSIHKLSTHNACQKDKILDDEFWYYPRSLPEFTVCTDCYNAIVRPRRDEDIPIALEFSSMARQRSFATCQLYSNRMREVFRKACRRDDYQYLADEVTARRNMEDYMRKKARQLEQDGARGYSVDEEFEKVARKWKAYA